MVWSSDLNCFTIGKIISLCDKWKMGPQRARSCETQKFWYCSINFKNFPRANGDPLQDRSIPYTVICLCQCTQIIKCDNSFLITLSLLIKISWMTKMTFWSSEIKLNCTDNPLELKFHFEKCLSSPQKIPRMHFHLLLPRGDGLLLDRLLLNNRKDLCVCLWYKMEII